MSKASNSRLQVAASHVVAGAIPSNARAAAADFDFEDAGERIKNLLSLAMFVERARHLTVELEAAADMNVGLQKMLKDRGIPYGDAYFQLDESLGLRALLRHAHELANEAKESGMALARALNNGATR
ncbi:hypothetical protein [Roseateles puraquae]|uniref:hypothetical protein n=1 Tax=Roseateles puraquae TaxID=431059 RepID=UPI0031D79B09